MVVEIALQLRVKRKVVQSKVKYYFSGNQESVKDHFYLDRL